MKKQETLENFPAYFAYLLSGLAFFSLQSKAHNFAGALAADLFVFAIVFSALNLLICLKNQTKTVQACKKEKFFAVPAIIFCAVLFAFFTKNFIHELSLISKEFSGVRFSHFFVILSLFLSLYIGKRGLFSYSGVCLLILPLLVLPGIITFFNFLDFGGLTELEHAAVPSISFEAGYFADAFLLCSGGTALFFMKEKNTFTDQKKGLGCAFFAFCIAVILEGIKYLMWFGSKNLHFIERPDRVMLSQVPFMNVQEIFVFSFYSAYILKISAFATAARMFASNISEKLPEWTSYAAIASIFCISYLFLPEAHGKILAVIAFCGLYLCGIGIYFSRILHKRHKSSKMSHILPQKTKC